MFEKFSDDFSHLSLPELIVAKDRAQAAYAEAKEIYEEDLANLGKWKKGEKKRKKKIGSTSHYIFTSRRTFKNAENTYSRLISAVERREENS